MSCFVPSCSNTIGVQFPKNPALVEKWLISLNLRHLQPHPNNFVCFDHFRDSDFLPTHSESLPKVKHGSIPIQIATHIYKDIPQMCRVCMSEDNLIMDISEPLDGIPVMSILMLCCYPIKMSLTDNLPTGICRSCLNDLKVANKLRLKCLDSVKKIQIKIEKHNSLKRKIAKNEDHVKKLKNEQSAEHIANINMEINRLELSEFLKIDEMRPRADIVPNIEEPEESIEKFRSLIDIQLSEFIKFDDSKYKRKKEVSNNDVIYDLTSTGTEKKTGSIIGQREVWPNNFIVQYISSSGVFPSTISCCYGNPFIEADQYIYGIGLERNQIRYIHCIDPTCRGYAIQNKFDNLIENQVTVIVPHNHPIFSYAIKHRFMFLFVLRKRMQQDKSLNIKHFYEDFLKTEPELSSYVSIPQILSEISKNPIRPKCLDVSTFEEFYENIDRMAFSKLQFTNCGRQFFQEKFMSENGHLAVIFCKIDLLQNLSHSKLMYVDASFKIDTNEDFKYQLVTMLLWVNDSYYPVLYAFVNRKSFEIFKIIFRYVYETLAPKLRPTEIVTDFEANLYYALGQTYISSQIGGSVFYFTQNLYKKVCSLNLCRDLETNSFFRNIYHMLLMVPLLPISTIIDGLLNIEEIARETGLKDLTKPLFNYVKYEWMGKVTPDLFCVHKLENRINENVIAPFKKLRDFLLVSKIKATKNQSQLSISQVVEKLIELEAFLSDLYTRQNKKSFGRDLSCSQKKNVLRAWLFIDHHRKININYFFTKVLGYLKCMENQLWIWGFYGYIGDGEDVLINASHFPKVGLSIEKRANDYEDKFEVVRNVGEEVIIMETVLDDGKIIIQNSDGPIYVYRD